MESNSNIEFEIFVENTTGIRLEEIELSPNYIFNPEKTNNENISLNSDLSKNVNGLDYYYGVVKINIKNNFNRATLIYLNNSDDVILEIFYYIISISSYKY